MSGDTLPERQLAARLRTLFGSADQMRARTFASEALRVLPDAAEAIETLANRADARGEVLAQVDRALADAERRLRLPDVGRGSGPRPSDEKGEPVGEIRVLCQEGDISLAWDPADEQSVKNARVEFARLKADGYELYEVVETRGQPVAEFDPSKEQLIAAPGAREGAPAAMAGGPVVSEPR